MSLIRHGQSNYIKYFLNRAWLAYKRTLAVKVGLPTSEVETVDYRGRQTGRQADRRPPRQGRNLYDIQYPYLSALTLSHTLSLFYFHFSNFFLGKISWLFCHKSIPVFVTGRCRGNRAFLILLALYAPALESAL